MIDKVLVFKVRMSGLCINR